MNKKIISVSIMLIFLMIGLSGCDELENLNTPNYITVTVFSSATVYSVTQDANVLSPGINVIFEIVKAGGERFDFYRLTTDSGSTESVTCSFKLYKEQNIVSYALPTGVGTGAARDSKTLTWATVSNAAKMGGTYTWNVHHDLYISSSG